MRPEQEQRIVEEHLRGSGFRWTNQRALIVRTALETHVHFTAEELLDLCRKIDPRVSRATVYRTLAVLEKEHFVEGLETGDGGRKFEHVLGHEHHDHMVCTLCGAIFEFQDPELERRQELAAGRIGFSVERHSLRIYGTCRRCGQLGRTGQKKTQPKKAQPKKAAAKKAQPKRAKKVPPGRKTRPKGSQKNGSGKRSVER